MPCSPLKVNRRFGGTCRLHLQGRNQATNQRESTWRYIPQDSTLHNHRCEHLKSYKFISCSRGSVQSRDSSVGVATGYGLDGRSSSPNGGMIFVLSMSRPVLGPTQPPIQWVPGVLSPRVKRLGREADPSPPTTAEVNNTWIYTSTPPYVFMA
jgi:hypothetical protein